MLKALCKFEYQREESIADLIISPIAINHNHSSFSITVNPCSPVDKIAVSIIIEADNAWLINPSRLLVPLISEASSPYPVGRFVVIKTADNLWKYDFPWAGPLKFKKLPGRVVITSVIKDSKGSGVSYWGINKLKSSLAPYKLTIYGNRLTTLADCLWFEPFPLGARSAICLTDHPDFDSVENVRLIADLFEHYKIRYTKAVFPRSEPIPGKAEPGLDIPEYRHEIERLYAQGSEIAFHGLSPRLRGMDQDECLRGIHYMLPFKPCTWIDHGESPYMFSRGGALLDGSNIADLLTGIGVINYWSYFDIWNNPFGCLSIWKSHDLKNIQDITCRHIWNDKRLKWKVAIFLLITAIKNWLGENEAYSILRRPYDLRLWRRAFNVAKYLARLRGDPLALYGLDGSAAFTGDIDAPWIFDTLLLNYLQVQLKPQLIDKLIQDSGLLLGHTYMGLHHRLIGNDCFEKADCGPAAHHQFLENLEYLSKRQEARDVITLPFADLRLALSALIDSSLVRTADGWLIRKNPSREMVVAGDHRLIESCRGNIGEKWFWGRIGYMHLPRGSEIIKIHCHPSAADG